MASFRIRPYREEDYDAARSLFIRGILEHAPTEYRLFLRSAWTQLGLLVLFVGARAAAGCWVLGLGAVALALVAMWLQVRAFVTSYIQQALGTDLQDIGASYLRTPNSCFWVAESGGSVVGTVGATPAQDNEAAMELKRMSVSKEHRGQGIAKALVGEVLRFARARGYGAVVLTTSTVQVVAQRLYEGQGFRKVATYSPSLLATLLRFKLFRYRYDLPGGTA
ncbi:NAT8 acetyltransferase, partial [Upupa epops]|nr:NAT8 acetyltransferase [Upupa epops]